MTPHKATITLGPPDAPIVYEGELEVDCYFTDAQWWKFIFDVPPFDNFDRICRMHFPSREAALADAKAHGIEIVEE